MFQVNEVLNLQDKLYRILVSIERHVVWISLDDSKALPDFASIEQLTDLLLQEKMSRVDDPYEYVQDLLPEEKSKEAIIRNKNYQIISPLVEDPQFYVKKVRTKHIAEILATGEVSRPYLYKLIRRYWQRGQTPNALLPDYKNSGAKGKKEQQRIRNWADRVSIWQVLVP